MIITHWKPKSVYICLNLKKMKRILFLISSLRPIIFHLFILAIFTIFLIDFCLSEIPQLFNGGFKLGQIIYKLSMSYISAFIFYFLVVHIKVQNDKYTVYPFVKLMVSRIINQATITIESMSKASQVKVVGKFPTIDEMKELCKGINPYADAPLVFSGKQTIQANWLQYFEYGKNQNDKLTQKIFAHLPFLDAELVTLLVKIQNNSHFSTIAMFSNTLIGNKDLEYFQDGFTEYLNLVLELQEYSKRKLDKYE